jgi:hypothetical protein
MSIKKFSSTQYGILIKNRFIRLFISLTIFTVIPLYTKDFFKNPLDYPMLIDILTDLADWYGKIISNFDINNNFNTIQLPVFIDISTLAVDASTVLLDKQVSWSFYIWLLSLFFSFMWVEGHIKQPTGCDTSLQFLWVCETTVNTEPIVSSWALQNNITIYIVGFLAFTFISILWLEPWGIKGQAGEEFNYELPEWSSPGSITLRNTNIDSDTYVNPNWYNSNSSVNSDMPVDSYIPPTTDSSITTEISTVTSSSSNISVKPNLAINTNITPNSNASLTDPSNIPLPDSPFFPLSPVNPHIALNSDNSLYSNAPLTDPSNIPLPDSPFFPLSPVNPHIALNSNNSLYSNAPLTDPSNIPLPDSPSSSPDLDSILGTPLLKDYNSIFDLLKTSYFDIKKIQDDGDVNILQKIDNITSLHEGVMDNAVLIGHSITKLENVENQKTLMIMLDEYNKYATSVLEEYNKKM